MQESSRERLAEHRILSGDRQVAGQGDVTGETVGTALDDADRREAQVMDGDDDVADNVTRIGDLFVTNSAFNFQFDFLEPGPGLGPGTWASVSDTAFESIRKVVGEQRGTPVRLQRASATSLPMRDASVDVVITDPPYYDMVEYADASDLFHVWLKRVLFDIEPDLFGPDVQEPDGLQDKNQEIIVRRVQEAHRGLHDTAFYESMLAGSFAEARRVLKPDGHLVVVFGHSDPDAWRRLLGALQTAGFVVTSDWPSRTESANTGVASIKVTMTIGCRVAPAARPLGVAGQVDREVADAVTERVRQWDADGLALEDQLMASALRWRSRHCAPGASGFHAHLIPSRGDPAKRRVMTGKQRATTNTTPQLRPRLCW